MINLTYLSKTKKNELVELLEASTEGKHEVKVIQHYGSNKKYYVDLAGYIAVLEFLEDEEYGANSTKVRWK